MLHQMCDVLDMAPIDSSFVARAQRQTQIALHDWSADALGQTQLNMYTQRMELLEKVFDAAYAAYGVDDEAEA